MAKMLEGSEGSRTTPRYFPLKTDKPGFLNCTLKCPAHQISWTVRIWVKNQLIGWVLLHTPATPAFWKAETGTFQVPGQPEQCGSLVRPCLKKKRGQEFS